MFYCTEGTQFLSLICSVNAGRTVFNTVVLLYKSLKRGFNVEGTLFSKSCTGKLYKTYPLTLIQRIAYCRTDALYVFRNIQGHGIFYH